VSAPKRRPADDVGPNAGGPLGDAAAVWLPLDALAPHPKNPRVHGAEVTRLARTILRTAWGAPIVAQWRASGRHRVIAGHGRLLAAREILAGVEVDGELRGGADHLFDASAPGPGLLPVRLVRVRDAEADAMTLADNARAIQGEDSAELIVEMAAQFGRDAAVMADIGFDGAALDALVKSAGDALLGGAGGSNDDIERHEVIGDDARERIEVEEDEAPVDRAEELRAKWNTAAGQLWEIPSATVAGGVQRILCGDSTKAEDVARVMAGDVAAVLHTDPPYGVDVVGGSHDPREAAYQSGNRVENDALEDADLEALVSSALANCRRHMVPGAAFYVWHASSRVELFCRAVASSLAKHRQIIVWVKPHFVFGRQDYHWQHEPCFYGWVDGAAHRWENDRKQTTVWQVEAVGTDLEKKLHPTAKPLALGARAIQNHTSRGEVVIEPFSGSGSTLVAAEQTGRICRAIEIAPKYVAVALERLSALGLTPRLVS